MDQTTLEASRRRVHSKLTAVLLMVGAIATCTQAFAQLGVCNPVSQRTGEVGCWIMTSEPLGQLSRPAVFWHLDIYPTRAIAEKAKGPRGTVVDSLGKVWLLTIAEAGWLRPVASVSRKSAHSQ